MTAAGDTWAIIAGGGTAGHVLPGLAIAREIADRGVEARAVHYVGSERGIERRLVPEAGFGLTVLPGRGIQRRLTPANIAAVAGLLRALAQGFRLVRRHRPAVVVGLGGYASVPVAVAAVVLRVPLVLAEQNAVPGAANRLLGRWARAAAVSFRGTDLPRAEWTGNPVRAEVLAVDRPTQREAARARLGVEADRKLVTVFGGSLGSRRINRAVLAALAVWRDRDDLHVRHVTGSRDHAELAPRVPIDDLDLLSYDLIEYDDDMPTVYAASDLVVCRSGATSVAELAAVGVPAVLVPLPTAPGDHQSANARSLEEVGAAVVVADAELDARRLVAEVDSRLADEDRLATMGASTASVARRDAAEAVVDLMITHARRPLPAPGPSARARRAGRRAGGGPT
ncbi:MAG: undecaprenyldiphospho-muramoylpentapeptide beta-N-acetylglucosaminyltransferase [Acidimicrobiales bacterium]